MRAFILFLVIPALFGCSQRPADPYVKEIKAHRKKLHDRFLSEQSPLLPEDKENFLGLSYFPTDSNYAFWAEYKKFDAPDTMQMPTTTERMVTMVDEGLVHFSVSNTPCSLHVFYDVDHLKEKGEKHYFIPFSDKTSAFSTYGGGRFLDPDSLRNDGREMWIDFNLAYNPYCAYNHNYSCPIPPKENDLPVKVEAGERKYH